MEVGKHKRDVDSSEKDLAGSRKEREYCDSDVRKNFKR